MSKIVSSPPEEQAYPPHLRISRVTSYAIRDQRPIGARDISGMDPAGQSLFCKVDANHASSRGQCRRRRKKLRSGQRMRELSRHEEAVNTSSWATMP